MDAPDTRAREVRLAIFDVDGIMTDGTLYVTDAGEDFVAYRMADGSDWLNDARQKEAANA